MNNVQNQSITLMQYIFLIHGAQIATIIFSLPSLVAEHAGTDGWMSIALNWLVTCLCGWLLLLTLQKYPTLLLPDLMERLFGKWPGKLLLLVPICYFSYVGWFILVSMSLFIKSWFLAKTPSYVILFLLAVPGYMLVRYGPRIHGRFCELIFYLTVWILLILLVPLEEGNWLHLLPVLKEGWMPIVRGAWHTFDAFAGIEIVLVYYPYLQKKQYALHGLLAANTLTFIIYLFITIICFLFFSPDGFVSMNQPMLILLKNIEFRFLERMDTLVLAAYLLVVFTAITPVVYCATFSISRLFGRPDHRGVAAIYFVAAIVLNCLVQPTWKLTRKWAELINLADLVLLIALPAALYIYVWSMEKVRKWRQG